MSFDLARFGLTEMLRSGLVIRRATDGSQTMEAAARAVCRSLYDGFVGANGERQCALVRCYKTHPFGALDTELQRVVIHQLADRAPHADMRCLTLLATVGDERSWNDRRTSKGHRAIPLPSPQIVERAPMIAQLVRQFGLDLAAVVNPSADVVRDLQGKTYGVFHVEHAQGSPYIPAQAEFVERYGIRSVVGFGGSLRTGDLYAVILFTRVTVTREVADRFRTVALDLKSALFDFESDAIFDAPGGAAAAPARR